MKVQSIRLDPLGSQEFPRPDAGVRVLAGELPALHLGERVKASVLEATHLTTLLDLKGARVLVDALPGLQPGAEVLVRVAGLGSQPLLQVSTPTQQSLTQLPPLAVGQEVSAQVVEQLSGNRLLIEVQGSLLEANAPEGLQIGAKLSVRVEQLHPEVVFHILHRDLGGEAEAARVLRAHLAHHVPAGDSLNTLRQELARLADLPAAEALPPNVAKLQALMQDLLPDEAPPDAGRLAAFVRDGGLHYEAKLLRLLGENPQTLARVAEGDLKGLLLSTLNDVGVAAAHAEAQSLRQSFWHKLQAALHPTPLPAEEKTPSPPALGKGREGGGEVRPQARSEPQDLSASIVNHLDHIETQQAVNLLAQLHGEPYLLQIPFLSGRGLSTAMLSIEPDGGKQGEEGERGKREGYNILFLLDLEGFGQTRIDAHLTTKTLKVIFYVGQSTAEALLHTELPAFSETLRALGYEEVLLAAKPLGQLAPEKRQKFDSLAVGMPASISLVDVRA